MLFRFSWDEINDNSLDGLEKEVILQKRSKEIKKEIKKKWEVPGFQELHFTFYHFFCSVLEKHPKVPEKFFVGFKRAAAGQEVSYSQTLHP